MIFDMADKGMRQEEIAQRFNLSQGRVSLIIGRIRQGNFPARRGRPRLDIPANDRPHYAKLRRHFGAEEAKRMMGVEV